MNEDQIGQIIRTGREMRRLQQLYFKLRKIGPPHEANITLGECKKLESEFDNLLDPKDEGPVLFP